MFYQQDEFLQGHNFFVQIGTETLLTVKSVTLPQYNIQVNEDLTGRTPQYSPGKGTWNPVTIVLYDHKRRTSDGLEGYLSVSHKVFGTLVHAKKSSVITGNSAYRLSTKNSFFNEEPAAEDSSERKLPEIKIHKIYGNKFMPFGIDDIGVGVGTFRTGGHLRETWTLKEPVLQGVDFGTMDYSNSELSTITMLVNYKYAVHASTTAITT